MGITIRRTAWRDTEAYQRLFGELHVHHVTMEPRVIKPMQDPGSRWMMRRFMGRKNAALFITEDGRTIGP